jgi:periplasmic divalent cation tolerance protein
MRAYLVLVTMPNKKSAKKLAKAILKKKLCACVSIQNRLTSFFYWDNKLNKQKESLLLIKTTKKAFKPLKKRIKSLHPYDVPEIIALKISKAHEPYLSWIRQTVKKES